MQRLPLARFPHRTFGAVTRWRRFNSVKHGVPAAEATNIDSEGTLNASMSFADKGRLSETELVRSSTVSEDKTSDVDLSDPNALPRRIPLEALGSEFTEKEYASILVHGRGIHLPFFHPRTNDIPVASIQFRSHYPRYLDLFTHFATHAASALGIPISRPFVLPTKRTLWTVTRGPFAHKKSQENFERRVHKRAIKAWDADPEVVDRWVRYLRRHAMGGVGMRVTKWERMPLGIGESRLAYVMDRLQKPATVDAQKIKALGEKIVLEETAALTEDNHLGISYEHKSE